jgi:predicted enzyme related to lactoylglutathione lyase
MGSPVTWFEINSKNPKQLHDFYASTFGWRIQPVEGNRAAVVDTDSESGISGTIGEAEGSNQVLFYIEVNDLEQYLARVESAGGRTVVPVTEIPDLVTFAQFADPEGNVVGLFKAPA